jgi:autotransporter-associated beta strand protein
MVSGNFKRPTDTVRRLRAVLLASSALCLASALPAAAQDATWSSTPGSGDYNTAANWTPAAVPTGTASFGLSGVTALSFSANATVGGWTFNALSSAYSFTTSHFLTFTGDGIVINGGSAAITNSSFLSFFNTSTAGSATITNNGSIYLHDNSTAGNANIVNNNVVQFIDASMAGSATIANNGSMYFYNNSTAGRASITNTDTLQFNNSSTAGSASIVNTGSVLFNDSSTAGSASIVNNFGNLSFYNSSKAGSASITSNGNLNFYNTSTADAATITNTDTVQFFSSSTAGNASIVNNSGPILFLDSSKAGTARIINNSGSVEFNDTSSAENATITNNASLTFNFSSTAGSAAITNNSQLLFTANSTAGNATITNTNQLTFDSNTTAGNAIITNSGNVLFDGDSTPGNAQLINTAPGAVINFFSPGPASDGKISAGSIAGNGRFDLNDEELTVGGNNLSTNVTGVLTGTGIATGNSLIKIGTGTLTLSGTNIYTGATEVNGGTLAVNGSIAASSGVTVNSGGTLGGTGTVGNTTIMSGGALAPGNSIGTLTVSGNLTFNSGTTYAVEVSPSAADRTNVSGIATLTGATVQAIALPGSFRAQTYTILNATGGFGGTQFAGITTSGSFAPGARNPHLTYDTTNVFLVLDPGTIVLPQGASANQSSVAGAINAAVERGATPPAGFDALLNMSGTQLGNALGQASGQPGASTAQAGFAATGQFINGVFDGAFGDGPGQGGAVGFAQEEDTANAFAARRQVSREAKDAYAAVTPRDRRAPSFEQRWNVWATAYGGNGRVNGDTTVGTSTTTSRVFGTVAGALYHFAPDTQAGFALGGAGSSFDIANGFGGGRADAFNAAVYARHMWGAAYVAGLLGYSWQDTTTDRIVTISGTDRLHASFQAQALAARLEGGWRHATPMAGITPYAALQTTSFYLPSYGETAALGSNAFALNYAAKNVTATRSELGAKFDKAMLVQGGVVTLKARTAWVHDWNTDRSATAIFQTLPGATFTVNGAQPAANAALVSSSAEMKWHNGWSLAANIDGEFSRTTASYTGTGSVKYTW